MFFHEIKLFQRRKPLFEFTNLVLVIARIGQTDDRLDIQLQAVGIAQQTLASSIEVRLFTVDPYLIRNASTHCALKRTPFKGFFLHTALCDPRGKRPAKRRRVTFLTIEGGRCDIHHPIGRSDALLRARAPRVAQRNLVFDDIASELRYFFDQPQPCKHRFVHILRALVRGHHRMSFKHQTDLVFTNLVYAQCRQGRCVFRSRFQGAPYRRRRLIEIQRAHLGIPACILGQHRQSLFVAWIGRERLFSAAASIASCRPCSRVSNCASENTRGSA